MFHGRFGKHLLFIAHITGRVHEWCKVEVDFWKQQEGRPDICNTF